MNNIGLMQANLCPKISQLHSTNLFLQEVFTKHIYYLPGEIPLKSVSSKDKLKVLKLPV